MPLQPRKHSMPQAVARNGFIAIGGILAPPLALPAQPGAQFCVRAFQQRAHIFHACHGVNRPQAGEPGGAAAARQTQQQRLRHIICRVAGGNGIQTALFFRFAKELLPRGARGHLQRLAGW